MTRRKTTPTIDAPGGRVKLAETGIEGRDPTTGRYLPGHKGTGGRPRGFDFRAIVIEKAADAGISVEDAIWAIFRSMLREASGGDVQAAKFLADKLCGTEPIDVSVTTSGADGPPVPGITDLRKWAATLAGVLAEGDGSDPAG